MRLKLVKTTCFFMQPNATLGPLRAKAPQGGALKRDCSTEVRGAHGVTPLQSIHGAHQLLNSRSQQRQQARGDQQAHGDGPVKFD